MAKYKTLQNGKYGYHYRGYQIIKDNPDVKKSTYTVLQSDDTNVYSSLPDFHEAEWRIDILTADPAEMDAIKAFSELDIYELNGKALELAHEAESKKLPKDKKRTLDLIVKIRDRKSEQKPILFQ